MTALGRKRTFMRLNAGCANIMLTDIFAWNIEMTAFGQKQTSNLVINYETS